MDARDVLSTIAKLSVDVVKHLKGKYPDEILEAFAFVGKYMTVASLPKEERQNTAILYGHNNCPLCQFYVEHRDEKDMCKGCVLSDPETPGYCGDQYTTIQAALKEGSATNVAFHLIPIVRRILKRKGVPNDFL